MSGCRTPYRFGFQARSQSMSARRTSFGLRQGELPCLRLTNFLKHTKARILRYYNDHTENGRSNRTQSLIWHIGSKQINSKNSEYMLITSFLLRRSYYHLPVRLAVRECIVQRISLTLASDNLIINAKYRARTRSSHKTGEVGFPTWRRHVSCQAFSMVLVIDLIFYPSDIHSAI